MELALLDIRNHGMSIRKAASVYGIPKSTIQDRVKGKVAESTYSFGPKSYLTCEEEKEIVEWILNMCKCGFPLKKDCILNTVQKIIKDSGRRTPFKDGRPGQTWLKLFFKRNPGLSMREAESISKGRAVVTEISIRQWFFELTEYLKDINSEDVLQDPSRVFNGDES
ncbi:uncharacterized protein LOC118732856, partial [Rhagoletis pomonella]|uniref:uncharacterized protein LOC118732856 n=1 Tax=Rhagoletis pomonella TaxID=28610 RepID=UPI00177D08BB